MARSDLARARVRRAYERSRAVDALVAMWPAPILVGVAGALHDHVGAGAVIAAAALAVVLAIAAWAGHSWRRGAVAGMLAGLLPLIVPAVVVATRGSSHCAGCTPSVGTMLACTIVCISTSLVAGIAVGIAAARDRSPLRFTAAALVAAAGVGLIACGVVGLGGSTGIVVGLVAGGIPTVALARRAT
jgi:hypothetical protein